MREWARNFNKQYKILHDNNEVTKLQNLSIKLRAMRAGAILFGIISVSLLQQGQGNYAQHSAACLKLLMVPAEWMQIASLNQMNEPTVTTQRKMHLHVPLLTLGMTCTIRPSLLTLGMTCMTTQRKITSNAQV
jgi:hypothetical protein